MIIFKRVAGKFDYFLQEKNGDYVWTGLIENATTWGYNEARSIVTYLNKSKPAEFIDIKNIRG